MAVFFVVLDWLLILTVIAFAITVAWIAVQILSLKRSVISQTQRLSARPVRSVKELINTVTGLADIETRRFRRVQTEVVSVAGSVSHVYTETREAVKNLPIEDMKSLLGSLSRLVNIASAAARAAEAGDGA